MVSYNVLLRQNTSLPLNVERQRREGGLKESVCKGEVS